VAATPSGKAAEDDQADEEDPDHLEPESEAPPPFPEGNPDDDEGAGPHKELAAELKANGDNVGVRINPQSVLIKTADHVCSSKALEAYTKALMCQSSALSFANRADCLLALKRPCAAIKVRRELLIVVEYIRKLKHFPLTNRTAMQPWPSIRTLPKPSRPRARLSVS